MKKFHFHSTFQFKSNSLIEDQISEDKLVFNKEFIMNPIKLWNLEESLYLLKNKFSYFSHIYS